MKIVSVGEITIDHYRRQDSYFIGGISLNFAVNAKRCGAERVSLVSAIGEEPDGQEVLTILAQEGVDASHVVRLPGQTATCAIDVDEYANRSFPKDGYQANVMNQLQLDNESGSFVQQHEIHVTWFDRDQPNSLFDSVVQLARVDQKRVVDFGDWSGGRGKDVPFATFNQIDLAFISGDESTVNDLIAIAAAVDCLIVITLGAAGSVALTKTGPITQPALPAPKVDSTGCGDAFQAAFTVRYYQGGDVKAALHAGASQAALVLQHLGAFSQSRLR